MGLLNLFRKKPKEVENNYVFDKAKYHADAVNDLGLEDEQAFVHTGLFMAWLIHHELMSDFFMLESGNEITQLTSRKQSPSSLYMNWDGVLIGEMLNTEGFNFSQAYFDFDHGTYMQDYERIFKVSGNQVFTIQDNWDNYDRLAPTIQAAYTRWKK
jgi:hypothetical protein